MATSNSDSMKSAQREEELRQVFIIFYVKMEKYRRELFELKRRDVRTRMSNQELQADNEAFKCKAERLRKGNRNREVSDKK